MWPPKNSEDLEVPGSTNLSDWYGGSLSGNSSVNWTEGYSNSSKEKPIIMLQICAVTYYGIVMPLGLVSNLLIIIPYLKNASLRRVTSNFFIVHMAVVNMVNICIFYPILLKIVFGGTGTTGNPTACLVMHVAFDMISIEPCLFSVLCVSVNQLLLIASPQKMYRRCCTHQAICAVLVVFWSCLFLKAGLQIAYQKVSSKERCSVKGFENEWMSDVILFFFILLLVIPTLTIPACHVTVLCYIRSSRKRAKGELTRRNNMAKVEMDEDIKGCTEVTDHTSSTTGMSMVTSVSMAPVSEVDSHHDPDFPSCSHQINSFFDEGLVRDNMNKLENRVRTSDRPKSHGKDANRNAAIEDEPPLKTVPTKHSLFRGLSRRFSSMRLTKRTCNRKLSRAPQGPGKAEVRLIKMMIAMYAILVAAWVASLSSSIFIKDRFVHFILFMLGGLVPLFHTLVPYIYLWGNRNYHEAIKTLFGFSRICRNRVRPN